MAISVANVENVFSIAKVWCQNQMPLSLTDKAYHG